MLCINKRLCSTGRTGGTSCASRTSGAGRSVSTSSTGRTGGASCASGTGRTGGTGCTSGAGRPSCASGTGYTNWPGDTLRPGRSSGTVWAGIALRACGSHGAGRAGCPRGTGSTSRPSCPSRSGGPGRSGGTGTAGRTGRRTRRRTLGRLLAAGEIGHHLALSAPPALRGIMMIHGKFLFPKNCGYATVHPMQWNGKCPETSCREGEDVVDF